MDIQRRLHLISRVQQRIMEEAEELSREDMDGVSNAIYPYIAMGHSSFAELVKPHLRKGMWVIDIGCGAGDKLMAFNKLCPGMHIVGLEYQPTMAALAQYMAPFATVLEGDAFKMDFRLFDLIYMYRPIPDAYMQSELQLHVMSSMRHGAILCVGLQETKIRRVHLGTRYYTSENDFGVESTYSYDEFADFPNLRGWMKL